MKSPDSAGDGKELETFQVFWMDFLDTPDYFSSLVLVTQTTFNGGIVSESAYKVIIRKVTLHLTLSEIPSWSHESTSRKLKVNANLDFLSFRMISSLLEVSSGWELGRRQVGSQWYLPNLVWQMHWLSNLHLIRG